MVLLTVILYLLLCPFTDMTGPAGAWKSRGVHTKETQDVCHVIKAKRVAIELAGLGHTVFKKMFGGASVVGPRAIAVADHCTNNTPLEAAIVMKIGRSFAEYALRVSELTTETFVILEGNFDGKAETAAARLEARKKAFADGKYMSAMTISDCMIKAMQKYIGESTVPHASRIVFIDPVEGEGEVQGMDMLRQGTIDVFAVPSRDFDVALYPVGQHSATVLLGLNFLTLIGPPIIQSVVINLREINKQISFEPAAAAAKKGAVPTVYDTSAWTLEYHIAVCVVCNSDYKPGGIKSVGLKTAVGKMVALLSEQDGSQTLTLEDMVRKLAAKCKPALGKPAIDALVVAALCYLCHPVIRGGVVHPSTPVPAWAKKAWVAKTALGKKLMDQLAKCTGRAFTGKAATEREYSHLGCSQCPNLDDVPEPAQGSTASADEGEWIKATADNLPVLPKQVLVDWLRTRVVDDYYDKMLAKGLERSVFDQEMKETLWVQYNHEDKTVTVKGTCANSMARCRRACHCKLRCSTAALDTVVEVIDSRCDPLCIRNHAETACTHRVQMMWYLVLTGLGSRTSIPQWWLVPAGGGAGELARTTESQGPVLMRHLSTTCRLTVADVDALENGDDNGDPSRKRARRSTPLDAATARRAAVDGVIAALPPVDRNKLAKLETFGGFFTRLNRYRDIPF